MNADRDEGIVVRYRILPCIEVESRRRSVVFLWRWFLIGSKLRLAGYFDLYDFWKLCGYAHL